MLHSIFCGFYNDAFEVSIDQLCRKFRGISLLIAPYPGRCVRDHASSETRLVRTCGCLPYSLSMRGCAGSQPPRLRLCHNLFEPPQGIYVLLRRTLHAPVGSD
jgi:hypothetical protein